jgi:hypothetical protein
LFRVNRRARRRIFGGIMHTLRRVVVPVVAVILSACGGSSPPRAPTAAAPPPNADACPSVPALAGQACATSRFAWVYGPPDELAPAIAEVDEAAELFHRHFGAYPARGAVVLIASPDAGARDELMAAGADWVLPMLSRSALVAAASPGAGLADAVRPQIRAQLEQQLGAASVTDAMVEGAVTQAVAQMNGGAAGAGVERVDAMNILGHELGHVWFLRMMDPSAPWEGKDTADHYGGALPDWIDETAAVLMENAALTENRRTSFRADVAAGRVVALDDLFTMTHPALDSDLVKEAMDKAAAGTSGTQVLVLRANDASAATAGAFYHQCRSLADFLLSRTNDDLIFLSIATALRDGATMPTWLAANAGKYRLPSTIAALDADWRAWASR